MFYKFMQLWVRLALFVFFKKIKTTDDDVLKLKGPMILASNHPNSFLDAIVLGAIYKTPVHYLVRGDAFKKPLMRKFFTSIKMLPIYRMSEGRENLKNNDETFEKCSVILKQKGIVLIFSEGLCINEWALRPLKKGTARIALQGFNDDKIGSDLSILPVGLNYNHFDQWGKSLQINWGDKIYIQKQNNTGITGAAIGEFNENLTNQLKQLVLSKVETEKQLKGGNPILKYLLFLPAILGFLVSFPFYYWAKKTTIKLNKGGVFYDSILFGLSMLLYPIYIILLTLLIAACTTRVFGKE